MTTKLAVIPARGGSKGLKNKNFYPLNGKPLIAYSIEAVLGADCFDTVLVSTDSEEIASIAESYGVRVYNRPPEYATDKMTVLEALVAMMDDVPRHDIFSYFLPTCPLVSSEDIKEGVSLLDHRTGSVVSVVSYADPIQLAMIKRGDEMIPIFDNLTAGLTNSRYLQKYYKPSGAFYMSWWDNLIKNKNFFVGNVKGYEMPKKRSVDIDDLMDIRYAELILKGL
tara:strand:+ start:1498 stop:2169 length:672 start_codon:yes stop_codon:yes gene_type:complete